MQSIFNTNSFCTEGTQDKELTSILIADDNVFSLKYAQTMLKKFANIVETANNGCEAFDKAI